jgi:hypothetical protein
MGLLLVCAAQAEPPAPAKAKDWTENLPPTLSWIPRLEFVEMLSNILSGGPPGPPGGWFHPTQTCYDFKWLTAHCGSGADGITREKFSGPAEFFDRLDRDHNGKLTPADFDWSEDSPLVRQSRIAERLFRRGDSDTNGRLTAAEWQALFTQAAGGKGELTPEDLQNLLFPPPPKSKGPPPGMPSQITLLCGLLSGEIGSPREGPGLGKQAPEFRLATHDGKQTIGLSDFRGLQPVVLIFGSFT